MHDETTKIRAIFVSYNQGEKNGKPYFILTLSNGLRAASAFLDESLDVRDLREGDEVEVEMSATINYKNAWDIKPISIEKVS